MIRMNGMSQTGMQAMFSAASSMKLAKVQGSTATQIKGRANVLEAEIKQDGGKSRKESGKQSEKGRCQGRQQDEKDWCEDG